MRPKTLQNKIYGLGKNMICTKKFSTSIFLALISLATPVLASNFSNFFSGGKVMYLVKGDGTTKIGPLVSYVRNDSSGQFELVYVNDDTGALIVSSNGSNTASSVSILGAPTTVYFSGTDCTGTAYLHTSSNCNSVVYGCFNPTYNGGTYLVRLAGVGGVTPQSARDTTGTCNNYGSSTGTYYPFDPTPAHPLCGDKVCKLKLMAP